MNPKISGLYFDIDYKEFCRASMWRQASQLIEFVIIQIKLFKSLLISDVLHTCIDFVIVYLGLYA